MIEPMQKEEAISELVRLCGKLIKYYFLSIGNTLTFLRENKSELIETGSCPVGADNLHLAGQPHLLYPPAKFLSESEMRLIRRELIFDFKVEMLKILETLKVVQHSDWCRTLSERVANLEKSIPLCAFHLPMDKLYAFQSTNGMPFESWNGGTFSETLETVSGVYDLHFSQRVEPLVKFLLAEGLIPEQKTFYSALKNRCLVDKEFCSQLDRLVGIKATVENFFLKASEVQRSAENVFSIIDRRLRKISKSEQKGSGARCLSLFSLKVRYGRQPFIHSGSYETVIYCGSEFHLTKDQSKIIQILHKNHELNGGKYMSQIDIGAEFSPNLDADKFRLDAKFKDKVAGKAKGKTVFKESFYRLIEQAEKNSESGNGNRNYYRLRLPKKI